MEYPHLAKALDGEITKTGRPYFAMELVNGISITEYCDNAVNDKSLEAEGQQGLAEPGDTVPSLLITR